MNSKRIAFGIGLVVVVLVIAVMTAPAMARDDEVVFHLNTSDGNHGISVAPGEEVTIYLNSYALVNKTGGFAAAVLYNLDVVEVVEITENESVTNWMMWEHKGHNLATNYPDKRYDWFTAVDFFGQGPGYLRHGDIKLRGVSPGVTTMFLGTWPDDILYGGNQTSITDTLGDYKDWTLAESFTFTCVGPAETFGKELVLGWNLISLPLTPTSNDTSAVLSLMLGKYDTVFRYDATSKLFEDVTTGTMDPGIGYFVNVTTAGTWSYEGTPPYNSMSIDLKQGLNMIGWLNCTKQISGNLTSIAGKYNYNARWNNGGYEVYEPHAPEVFNDFFDMKRGEGYWIAAKEDCTLTVSCSG